MAELHIMHEFKAMRKDKENQYKIELINDNFLELRAEIPGPLGTPYEGGKFVLVINVPSLYPQSPPKVRFSTNVWHPNILPNSGHICMDILYNKWTSNMSLRYLLLAIQFLMTDANPNDCYNIEAGAQLIRNPDIFQLTAKHWTNAYAGGPHVNSDCNAKVKFLTENYIEEDLARLVLSEENWDVETALEKYQSYYVEGFDDEPE